MKLVIASRNKGKISEIRELLKGLPIVVKSIDDFLSIPEIEETGQTFEENARIKAESIHAFTKAVVLADDSGLEVDALNGKPGVLSSRFAGPDASDADKCNLILDLMRDVPDEKRTARFRAAVCIIDKKSNSYFAEGVCEGIIAHRPTGENGFGYDPIFYLPDRGKTMAELTPEEKNAVSHRGRALRAAASILDGIISADNKLCGRI